MITYNALITEKLKLLSDIQTISEYLSAAKKLNQDTASYQQQLDRLKASLEEIDSKIHCWKKKTG